MRVADLMHTRAKSIAPVAPILTLVLGSTVGLIAQTDIAAALGTDLV